MAQRKSKSQLEAELRVLNKAKTSEGIVMVLLQVIKWGAVVSIFRYGYLSIETLAGKRTFADIGVNFLTDIKISVVIALASCVGGIIYGLRQRKLRKDTVERLVNRIQELEGSIDENRTSSRLTSRGDTRPEDIL